MKVIFINDSTSNPNWGDRAAATSLRRMIRDAGGDIILSISEADLARPLLGEPRVEAEAEPVRRGVRDYATLLVPPAVPRLGRRLAARLGLPRGHRVPERWEGFPAAARAFADDPDAWPSLFAAARQAAVAVIHGDGAMVGNGTVPRTMLFLAYVLKTAFDVPVVIANHTADFDHADLREIAGHVYPLFADVVFREPESVERCAGICTGRFAPDSAFQFEPLARERWVEVAGRATYMDVWPDTAAVDPAAPYLCLGGSSLYIALGSPEQVAAAYMALIERVRGVYTGQIVLTVSDLRDQEVMRAVAAGLGLPLVGLHTPVQQVVDLLGNADAYIGGRWHPSIFALRGGAPIIPLSSRTFKMGALARMAGLSAIAHDALNLGGAAEPIIREFAACLEAGTGLRDRLQAWAGVMARESSGNAGFLLGRGEAV